MPRVIEPSEKLRDRAGAMMRSLGVLKGAAALEISPGTLKRIASGRAISESVASRAERIIDKIRTADEFKGSIARGKATAPPRSTLKALCWTVESIRAARDAQQLGQFRAAVALAQAMRTDDALFVAYNNRLAPHDAIAARLQPHDSVRGRAVEKRARLSVQIPLSARKGIHGTLVNHGIAIGHVISEVNREGTQTDMRLEEWPLEFVRWNPSQQRLETQVRNGMGPVEIRHGDGEWIVFKRFGIEPWNQDACVLPGGLIWASHAEGLGDWNSSSNAHGLARIVGELPEGVALEGGANGQDEQSLSPAASALLDILLDLASGEAAAGVIPAGSKANFLSNGSTAWQVWKELLDNREKAAARVYLGTDAILGSMGGAPGVDIAALFGVATTKLQSDFRAIEEGINSGLLQIWTAVNFGDSALSPKLVYALPDPDAARVAEETEKGIARLTTAISQLRAQQLEVNQQVVDNLAAMFSLSPAPKLAAAAAVPVELAPTDIAEVVRVGEARASRNLPPVSPEIDTLFISQLKAQNEANAKAKATAAEAAAVAAIPKPSVPAA